MYGGPVGAEPALLSAPEPLEQIPVGGGGGGGGLAHDQPGHGEAVQRGEPGRGGGQIMFWLL